MLVKVIDSTDGKFVGLVAPLPSPGDVFVYGEYEFDIVGVNFQGNGIVVVWNYNYIVKCKILE